MRALWSKMWTVFLWYANAHDSQYEDCKSIGNISNCHGSDRTPNLGLRSKLRTSNYRVNHSLSEPSLTKPSIAETSSLFNAHAIMQNFHDNDILQEPYSSCNLHLQEKFYTETGELASTSGDMLLVQISLQRLHPIARYHLLLYDMATSEKVVWSKNLSEEDCEHYREKNENFLSFEIELEYFRACRQECHKPRQKLRLLPRSA